MRHPIVFLALAAGGTLTACHHRQSEPVYTAPAETVSTTTTTTTTVDTTMSSSSSSSNSASAYNGTNIGRGTGTGTGTGAGRGEGRSERREIRLAITSLERARAEMERAGHDFGGRKAEAMKATEGALRELRLANGQEAREARAGGETTRERRTEGRELHAALADLERSRADIEHGTQNFNGRRKEALDAVDAAIREIRRAAEFEK